MEQDDHSKYVEILRTRCEQLKNEILSYMTEKVLFKISDFGCTPEEIASRYIYTQFVNENENQYYPVFFRLIFNNDKSKIIDIIFDEYT